jgi:uncharacterized RDD family membrane protein YckC
MKRLIHRVLAFMLDLFIINLLLFAISNISFINTNKKEISYVTTTFREAQKQYNELSGKIDKILTDKYIDLGEGLDLKTNYSYYYQFLYYIPLNEELNDEQIESVRNTINNSYKEAIYEYNYYVSKYSIKVNIIGIVLSILYFGVFEWYKKGKTIGKMVMRVKTVPNNPDSKNIPLYKYLIKAVLVSGVLFTTANIIITLISHGTNEGPFGLEWYNQAYAHVYNVQYIYNTLFMLLIFIRRDERSIHDVLLGIKVILHDKKGKEIESSIFNEEVSNKTN